LTLRQFYLLLAEWYHVQSIEERRFYLLFCRGLQDPEAARKLFPLLQVEEPDRESEPDPEDDIMRFNAVTAALTSYSK